VRKVRVHTPSSDGRAVTSYVHMTALAVRYESGRKRRFASESRMARMEQLRALIERDDYAVDPEKVADAIVRRLMLEAAPRRG
jgi:anti-sigma28 factor (negative regulator of flagellin synthesis)